MAPGMKYSKSNRHPDCKCTFGKQKGYISQNTTNCPVHQNESIDEDGDKYYVIDGHRIYFPKGIE